MPIELSRILFKYFLGNFKPNPTAISTFSLNLSKPQLKFSTKNKQWRLFTFTIIRLIAVYSCFINLSAQTMSELFRVSPFCSIIVILSLPSRLVKPFCVVNIEGCLRKNGSKNLVLFDSKISSQRQSYLRQKSPYWNYPLLLYPHGMEEFFRGLLLRFETPEGIFADKWFWCDFEHGNSIH